MSKLSFVLALLGASLMASTSAHAGETNITAGTFKYGTISYFRGKAENVRIGSYGQKKTPLGSASYLSVQSKVKDEYLTSRVKYLTTATIDWSKHTKVDVEINGLLEVFGLGSKSTVGFAYEKVKTANLKLVKFGLNEGPLKTMLNTDADGARNYLADEGGDGRIVAEVWVVMEATLADHFAGSSVIYAAGPSGLDVTAKGGIHGTQTITISAGTTFAYMLYKVKDWNSGKTKIEDMEDDQKGLN